jgi:hypothetical protein
MEKSKNQRQSNPGRDKRTGKPGQHESAKQRKHERKNEPVASHPSDAGKGMAAVPDREQSVQGQRIVTNQDEQRKATNTGNTGEVMGEEETEGDTDKRIKPYKNIRPKRSRTQDTNNGIGIKEASYQTRSLL